MQLIASTSGVGDANPELAHKYALIHREALGLKTQAAVLDDFRVRFDQLTVNYKKIVNSAQSPTGATAAAQRAQYQLARDIQALINETVDKLMRETFNKRIRRCARPRSAVEGEYDNKR